MQLERFCTPQIINIISCQVMMPYIKYRRKCSLELFNICFDQNRNFDYIYLYIEEFKYK